MSNKSHQKKDFREMLSEAWDFTADVFYNIIVIVLLVIFIRSFVISPFRVVGSSMADTLENNEFIIIDKLSYVVGKPDRGDPVVFLPPMTNRYSHKFSESVRTNESGEAQMDIMDFVGYKNASYCQKKAIRLLWICKEKVREGDMIYVTKPSRVGSDPVTSIVQKLEVSAQNMESGVVNIKADPNSDYQALVYNDYGDEYFVKRVIGVPGDSVRIENGRVYLKKVGSADFREIGEPYLNGENRNNTYIKAGVEESEFVVPEGQYFVLGDNRNHSNDSRSWLSPLDQLHTPFVPENQISGKVAVVLWPITDFRVIGGADL